MDTMEDVVPYDLLLRIISFLPSKDQVRSSLVSKKWKELWKQTGVLDFDSANFSQSGRKFADFVSWSVDQQRTPIRSFRIALCTLTSNISLQDLLNKIYSRSSAEGNIHLREMEIDLNMKAWFDSEFWSKSDEWLRIWHVFPTYHGLKRLSLKNIRYQPAAIISALSNCLCLEDLCLENIAMSHCDLRISRASASMLRHLTLQNICLCTKVVVDAPKLSSFSYEGPRDWFFESEPPSAFAADYIRLLRLDCHRRVPTSFILSDVSGVKFLRIDLSFIFMWTKLSLFSKKDVGGFKPQRHPTNQSFKNLEELVISLHHCWGREWLVGFYEFLKVINPNLKHLTLQTHKLFSSFAFGDLLWDFEGYLDSQNYLEFIDPIKRSHKEKLDCLDGLACNLKTFKMSYVGVRENEMLFIKKLLNNNGGALESVQLITTDEENRKEIISTLKKQVHPSLFEHVKVAVSSENTFCI